MPWARKHGFFATKQKKKGFYEKGGHWEPPLKVESKASMPNPALLERSTADGGQILSAVVNVK